MKGFLKNVHKSNMFEELKEGVKVTGI